MNYREQINETLQQLADLKEKQKQLEAEYMEGNLTEGKFNISLTSIKKEVDKAGYRMKNINKWIRLERFGCSPN